ncbi:MAG: phosphosulfolactate synthase [Dethiobacteria bacterium]|jgi:phosphosulfolactate synthase
MKREKMNGWSLDFDFPLKDGYIPKPRTYGLTMLLDRGLGLRETNDLLEMCADYIDFWKLGFGTSALYHPFILRNKINVINSYNVKVMPGGTFTEIMLLQGKLKPYLDRAAELGFSALEISEGTIEIPSWQRSEAIKMAREKGFQVLTEVGKKESGSFFDPELKSAQILKDLEDGAFKVILEGRESGRNVTIFNEEGEVEQEKVNRLLLHIGGPEEIIWEAPLKEQQVFFIKTFGAKVNLGNIHPVDLLSLQALRSGLRSDTLRLTLAEKQKPQISH